MKESMLEAILKEVDDPAERESLQQAWDHLGELEGAEPPSNLEERFAGTMEIARVSASRSASGLRRLLPLAAVLVIGIVLGILAVRPRLISDDDRVDIGSTRAELARLGRTASFASEPRALAPHRLDAVEALAGLVADPEARRILIRVVRTDPSVDVRLCAIDAIGAYADEEAIARPLIETARDTESTLVRIRLIEVLVERDVDAALPTIRLLARDPRADELVRETAQWASEQL